MKTFILKNYSLSHPKLIGSIDDFITALYDHVCIKYFISEYTNFHKKIIDELSDGFEGMHSFRLKKIKVRYIEIDQEVIDAIKIPTNLKNEGILEF